MFKKLFASKKKEETPDELGAIIYQVIQMGLSDPDLSIESLLKKLELSESELTDQYQSEVIIALMFQAILVVENQYDYPLAGDILDGMTKEFIKHFKEMGATEENAKYFLALFHLRMKGYYEAERNKTGDGPAYWVGKQFFENLTEHKQNNPDMFMKMKFVLGTNYLTSTLTGLDSMLKGFTVKKQMKRNST